MPGKILYCLIPFFPCSSLTEGWVSSGSGEGAMPIAIGCWRGRTNISVMVNANDCQELLERVSALRTDDAMESDDIPIPEANGGLKNGSDCTAD